MQKWRGIDIHKRDTSGSDVFKRFLVAVLGKLTSAYIDSDTSVALHSSLVDSLGYVYLGSACSRTQDSMALSGNTSHS